MVGGEEVKYARYIRDTGVDWGLIGIVTSLETIGRNYPEVLKYGLTFNTSMLKSKGETLLWTNVSI